MTWASRRRIQLAYVQDGGLSRAKEAQARGKLVEDRSADRRAKRGVVPGAEPRCDPFRTDADALHRLLECPQRAVRKLGRVLLAGESFFLIVAEDAGPVVG